MDEVQGEAKALLDMWKSSTYRNPLAPDAGQRAAEIAEQAVRALGAAYEGGYVTYRGYDMPIDRWDILKAVAAGRLPELLAERHGAAGAALRTHNLLHYPTAAQVRSGAHDRAVEKAAKNRW